MRRVSANYIYPVESAPLKNGIVEIDDTGKIQQIIDTKGDLRESRKLEFYNGVITPGFINTHCHLELSELKEEIKEKKGLPDFLNQMISYKRKANSNTTIQAIKKNDGLMRQNGIVAVGDISNTDQSIPTKRESQIYYHTFIEAIGLGSNAEEIFRSNKELMDVFLNNNLKASITPHAPYSVSKELFLQIKNLSEELGSVISIHNQESAAENQMFKTKSGGLVDAFQKLGIDLRRWQATGESSIKSITSFLPRNNTIIFVHNTFSSPEDVSWMNEQFPNAYWCLCPKSNLYIENTLPDLNLFYPFSNRITLGTDSLASNTTLSILDEMKSLMKQDDQIEFEQVLKWGTWNGAKALKIDQNYGSIKTGKTPGLNLITDFDFTKMKLSQKSEIKVLV